MMNEIDQSLDLEEEQGYFISISDLMSGLIFLFVITLMIFVLNFSITTSQLTSQQATKEFIMKSLQKELEKENLSVTVTTDHHVLRLTGSSKVDFESGWSSSADEAVVEKLGKAFDSVLPCFVYSSHNKDSGQAVCDKLASEYGYNPVSHSALIDGVLIEGHTDQEPCVPNQRRPKLGCQFDNNFALSAARSAFILDRLEGTSFMGQSRDLRFDQQTNSKGQAILSVSGYAERRMLKDCYSPDVKDIRQCHAQNRRIDIRLLIEPTSDYSRGSYIASSAKAEALGHE